MEVNVLIVFAYALNKINENEGDEKLRLTSLP